MVSGCNSCSGLGLVGGGLVGRRRCGVGVLGVLGAGGGGCCYGGGEFVSYLGSM